MKQLLSSLIFKCLKCLLAFAWKLFANELGNDNQSIARRHHLAELRQTALAETALYVTCSNAGSISLLKVMNICLNTDNIIHDSERVTLISKNASHVLKSK